MLKNRTSATKETRRVDEEVLASFCEKTEWRGSKETCSILVFSEVLVLPKMQIPIPLFTFHPFLFVASVMHVLYSFMSLVNSLLQLPQYLSAANDTLSGLASLRRHFRSSSRRRIGRPAGVRGVGRTTVSVPASVSARSVFRASGSRRRLLRGTRRVSRSFRRRRRASRRTPSRSRRPNFQRRRMKMRPFNKAPFTISKFLSSGAPLPKMTFCRLRFYSQKQVSFDGTSVGKAQRVLILTVLPINGSTVCKILIRKAVPGYIWTCLRLFTGTICV